MVSATSRSSCAVPIRAGDGSDLGVDAPRRFDGQRRGGVDGGLRDQPGPPRRHRPDVDLGPQTREAVAQLEGVADELLRRRGRDPEDGAELGDAELRDQRAPSPAMGSSCSQPGTVNAAAEWMDSGGWRSAHRAARSSWSAAARSSGSVRARIEASTSEAVRSLDLSSVACCQRLDHVFDSRRSHRQSDPQLVRATPRAGRRAGPRPRRRCPRRRRSRGTSSRRRTPRRRCRPTPPP